MRVMFTTVGLPGHFFPLVPLAWAARVLGHEVLVVTSDAFVPTVLRSGLPATSYGATDDFVDLARRARSFRTLVEQRHGHGRMFGRIAARGLPGTDSLVRSWRPDLVVSERAEFSGPIAARTHRVPHVELHWGVAALGEYRSGAAVELRRSLAALGQGAIPRPALTVDPWPPSLRLSHAGGHQSMRYVPYNGDAHVAEWMVAERSRPTVCLSLGTVVPRLGRASEVGEWTAGLLAELARLDVQLLVAVADEVAASWPELPSAVRYTGRMPLAQVLRATDLFVNHGGQGTLLTALDAGCPQLMLPVFDDQFDNTNAVVRAGAGVCMPPDEVEPRALARRCAELLRGTGHREAASGVAAEIAGQPSPVEIVELLAELAGRPVRAEAA